MGHWGWIHNKRSQSLTKTLSPISFLSVSYGHIPGFAVPVRGDWRCTGAPPFLPPGSGPAALRNSHLRNTPGGSLPSH